MNNKVTHSNKKPDWLSMQYDSFKLFFSKDTPTPEFSMQRVLERHNPIKLDDDHMLEVVDWRFSHPTLPPQDCINSNQDYAGFLSFTFALSGPKAGDKPFRFGRRMASIPVPTEDGEFIFSTEKGEKANRYTLSMQMVPAPGLSYKEKESDSRIVRHCRIIPIIGKKIHIRATNKKPSVNIAGFRISLYCFLKFLGICQDYLADDNDETTWLVALQQLYKFLDQRGLVPPGYKMRDVLNASINDLEPLKGLFSNYITSFDLSGLGKKQIAAQQSGISIQDTTKLTLEEIEIIVTGFLEGQLTPTDSRSLKNRKVKLFGDFLFERLDRAMGQFVKSVPDAWELTKAGKLKDVDIIRPVDVVPFRPFKDTIESFVQSELFHLLDDTNPLSELSQKRRVTFRGPGGVPESGLFLDMRDVHPMDFGRLCPVESPQGKNLGLNLYLARDAKVNSLGLIEARYLDCKSGETLYLDPYEEEQAVKAVQINGRSLDGEIVPVRTPHHELAFCDLSDSEAVTVSQTQQDTGLDHEYLNAHSITHRLLKKNDFLGYAASLIPFLQHNDANRALMGTNMIKQALALENTESPLIKTGSEKDVAILHGKDNPFIKDGLLCLGRNLLVGYMPWDLLNYEDGLVINKSLVEKDRFTHVETEEVVVDEVRLFKGKEHEEITRDNPHVEDENFENLDDSGVIRKGSAIEPGTLLVSKVRFKEEEQEKRIENMATQLMLAIHGKHTKPTEDASFYAPELLSGIVKDVQWEVLPGWWEKSWFEAHEKRLELEIEATVAEVKDLPPGVFRRIRIMVEKRCPIHVGDKLTGRHGNKGVVSKILPEREMPYFKSKENFCSDPGCPVEEPHTHLEILVNPLTITGRMNLGQLYETTLGWLAAHQEKGDGYSVPAFDNAWTWERLSSALKENGLTDRQSIFFMDNGKEIKTDRPVTVGYQYFLKLKHLAGGKLKARGRFAYSPLTGQPTVPALEDKLEQRVADKSSAQRLGEMEVWALEGHMARNILDEFLSLKSDEENLRGRLVGFVRAFDRERKGTFREFIRESDNKNWEIVDQKTHLEVKVSNEKAETGKGLQELARNYGLTTERKDDGTYCILFAPLEIFSREYRAFRSLIHYCRALGVEIKGLGKDGRPVKLAGRNSTLWPPLTGLSISIAMDKERRRWANNQVVTSPGALHSGLWSDDFFGKTNAKYRGERLRASEDVAVIELPVPIDNPIFRPSIELLLNETGYRLENIETEFKSIIVSLFPGKISDWETFWNEVLRNRSPLQSVQDLVDWLLDLAQDFEASFERRALTGTVKDIIPDEKLINFRTILDPISRNYLGAKDLYRYFEKMDMEKLRQRMENVTSLVTSKGKKLKLVTEMLENKYKPTIFFMKNLLVLPKNLRFEKDGHRFSQSTYPQYENDLNLLYRNVIQQVQKIENNKDIKPESMRRHEEEHLRRLVYGLLVNNKGQRILERPLKRSNGNELAGILAHISGRKSGKEGIFRKHLLGKRIDFSGRGVIVPDPDLNLDEAGLPFSMGKTLFRDLLEQKALKQIPDCEEVADYDGKPAGRTRKVPFSSRLAEAKAFLRNVENEETVFKWLEELGNEYFVLLNRAPSLHRLSILAFRPRFHKGWDVIRLNPYVCAPFNADFDGDTMAVYLPVLPESNAEAAMMVPSRVLRSPGHGRLVISSKGDLALAWHLLTRSTEGRRRLASIATSEFRETGGKLKEIKLPDFLENLERNGHEEFAEKLAELTRLFRDVLNCSGFSLGVTDFILDGDINEKIASYPAQYRNQSLNFSAQQIQFWLDKSGEVKGVLENKLEQLPEGSPLKTLVKSGASKVQLAQLSGMRGIMLRPGGEYVPYPVCSNIVNGMDPLDYFVSCHGSRHGLADKGLMTGPAGDLTNILIQAAQAEYIVEEDCGTENGLWFTGFADPAGGISLKERVTGRSLAEDLTLKGGETVKRGTLITADLAERFAKEKKWIKLLSPITCQAVDKDSELWRNFVENTKNMILAEPVAGLNVSEGTSLNEDTLLAIARHGIKVILVRDSKNADSKPVRIPPVNGICRRCYGVDLTTGELPEFGYPAGIIAAQSIGEPGTQLTLRTFHTGGTAGQEISQGLKVARRAFHAGMVQEKDIRTLCYEAGPLSVADDLIYFFQKIYNVNSKVADHHFEVILRTMLQELTVPDSKSKPFRKGEVFSLHQYLALEEKPKVVPRSVLRAGSNVPGFLGRIAFRKTAKHLAEAALRKETDHLRGLKSRLMVGRIR